MSRRQLTFPCENALLCATLDEGTSQTGLLMVSGGNETRAGAFSGMAQLAARIAERGHPVIRFDRRGVGDSTGENRGYRESGYDMQAAIARLLIENPQLKRVVGFGNCDAASALMLFRGAGCHSLVLANPWTFEDEATPTHSATELRSRYAGKLRNPGEVLRLLTGKVSLRKLAGGLKQILFPAKPKGPLVDQMQAGLISFKGPVRFLIADRDRTGLAFQEAWQDTGHPIHVCPDATHGFAEPHARQFLFDQLVSALKDE